MERLDRVAAYFNEREKKRLEAKTKESFNGVPEMSVDEIRLSCLENNGYETPELNDKLYLHFRGFRRIANLDAYTGCKSIWLDSNGFDTIENLDALKELRCLYLSKNLIRKVEGLSSLLHLTILDLSYNRLTRLENLSCCPALQTLNVANNSLSTVDSIRHLEGCTELTNVDLTNNRLENNEEFIAFFPTVPKLSTLSVNGNDITKISSFRKKLIAAMPRLGYLDRPVEEQERIFSEAFVRGGNEAETIARQEWKEKQTQKRINEMQEFRAWQKEQQRLREVARAEGRPLIKEFTQEEQEERRLEAERAAKAEKDMLANGIDKLAGKYWQLDGQKQNQHKDILEIAAEQLQREKEEEQEAEKQREEAEKEEVAVGDITIEVDNSPVRDGLTAATAISADFANTKIIGHKIEIDADQDEEEEEEEKQKTADEEKPKEPTAEELRAKEEEEEKKRRERERQQQEEREHFERQKRVHDSFEIYKRQYEARKNQSDSSLIEGGNVHKHHDTWASASLSSTTSLSSSTLPSSTTAAATATSAPSVYGEELEAAQRPLYWSEVMDIELAKQVKANVFDFERISACMIEAARKRRLDNLFVHRNPEALTKDVCRLRWAELDASVWSVQAPGVTATDTIFRINLTDDILQQTGGAQPSYEVLSTLARGNRPGYLKTPTAFPSVQDINDELD